MISDYFPKIEGYLPNAYLRSLIILLLIFVAIWGIMFVIRKIITKLTQKTKTNIDDIIIKKSSKPIISIAFFIGVRLAVGELPLPEEIMKIFVNVINSFLIVTISWLSYAILDIVILHAWRQVAKRTKSSIDDSLFNLVHGLLKAVWVIFTIIYILDLWGVEIGPFLAGLGIGGLAIAFALQESLSNIFGGVSIILDKSVRVGDLVYLDDGTQGKILHIGLRGTRIRTFDNEVVVVPNGMLANSKIKNVALPDPKTRIVVPFGVAYGSDVDKVKKIVVAELKKVENCAKEEEPIVRFMQMADSSLNFNAYFFVISFEHRADALDEANTRIYNALNKANIEIPFPQMDVHLKK